MYFSSKQGINLLLENLILIINTITNTKNNKKIFILPFNFFNLKEMPNYQGSNPNQAGSICPFSSNLYNQLP